jgi:hypothetical protein
MSLHRRDRGQATVLVLAVALCALLTAVATARAAHDLLERRRAQDAADAAALAGVTAGRQGALRLAARAGATLTWFAQHDDRDGTTVDVIVELGRASARASASDAS